MHCKSNSETEWVIQIAIGEENTIQSTIWTNNEAGSIKKNPDAEEQHFD